jgi:hypothetical protein
MQWVGAIRVQIAQRVGVARATNSGVKNKDTEVRLIPDCRTSSGLAHDAISLRCALPRFDWQDLLAFSLTCKTLTSSLRRTKTRRRYIKLDTSVKLTFIIANYSREGERRYDNSTNSAEARKPQNRDCQILEWKRSCFSTPERRGPIRRYMLV